jgi:hypothetical protein
VFEPYRSEIIEIARRRTEADIEAMEAIVRRGGTFFSTPEGTYTPSGEMARLRRLLPRLAASAESVFVIGISYDALRSKRMSMLYRLLPVRDRAQMRDELAVARPVTVTQLLATWLVARAEPFTREQAREAVRSELAAVPAGLFVDPELLADPDGVTDEALRSMTAQGFVRESAGTFAFGDRIEKRWEARFDVFAYHARFYEQSVEAATRLSASPA